MGRDARRDRRGERFARELHDARSEVCNVFRLSRLPELVWAVAFTLLASCTHYYGTLDWQSIVAISVGVAAVQITRDTRKPGNHIVGSRTLNPGLQAW